MVAQARGYIPESHLKRPLSPHIMGGWFNSNPWSRVMYVDSSHRLAGDTGRDGFDYEHPLATLAKAVSDIVTKGWTDTLVVIGPSHTETLTTSLTVSIGGIQIVGLGAGTRKPTFTLAGTTATSIVLSGSAVRLENVKVQPGIASLGAGITMSGINCHLKDVYYDDSAAYQSAAAVSVTGDDCLIEGLRTDQSTAGAAAGISAVGADRLHIANCIMYGDYSTANISNPTVALVNMLIEHCYLENLNAVDCNIDLVGTATGSIAHNKCRIATDGETTWIDDFDGQLFENYGVNNDGETGKLIGTASV